MVDINNFYFIYCFLFWNTLLKYISKFILNYVLGWKIINTPNVKKAIIIGYPHTSLMDSFLILLYSNIHIGYGVIKGEYFVFRILANLLGHINVTINKNKSQVDTIVNNMKKKEGVLYIAPTGSRSKKQYIRTGFYYIAKKANVPLICGCLNYKTKHVSFGSPICVKNISINECTDKINKYYIENNFINTSKNPSQVTPFKLKDIN